MVSGSNGWKTRKSITTVRPSLALCASSSALEAVDRFLGTQHPRRTKRLRQVVGVVVRMLMERRGWQKTGRKGSLGVRAKIAGRRSRPGSYHNTGGLAFWFLRAERYERKAGMPFQSVRQRRRDHEARDGKGSRTDRTREKRRRYSTQQRKGLGS